MGEIHSAFTLDTKPLDSSLEKAKQHVQSTMSDIEKSGMGVEEMLGKIGKMAGAAFAAFSAQQFISQVMEVRKEFQSLEVSFTTLLGSAEKGKKMFNDITKFATSTPMLEKDLAAGAQTLLGFNIEAEKVMPILQQIGDISMGDSQKFQSLILAFAQASSTGKLMGQDLLQMINAGFNPLAEISRTTGRSLKDLKEDMSNGKISVDMLEGAFKTATSEGGKFNGMLESMSHTLEGAESNLQGAIQKLLNDVGQQMEQPIIEGMTGATEAVNYFAENIDTLAAVVKSMVIVFGAYKTACIAVTVANNAAAASEGVYSVATTAAYLKTQLLTKAQALLNATMLANPYVLAATLLAAFVTTLVAAESSTDAAANAQKTLNKELENAEKKEQDLKVKMDKYIQTCNDDTRSTEERQEALHNLYKYYPNIISKYVDEEGHLKNIIALKREIAALDNEKSKVGSQQKASLMQQYADVMRKVARSKNGTADLSGKELDTYKAANKYYSDNNSWLTLMGSGAKDKAAYFENLSKGFNLDAQKKQTQQSITKFEDRLNDMGTSDLGRFKKALTTAKGKLNDKIKMVDVKGFGFLDESQVNMLLDRVTKQHDAKSGANSLAKAYKAAEKNYRNAVNTVDKIEANKAKYTTAEYTKAKDDLKAAEEELKKYGGKTDKQTAADNKKSNAASNKAAKEAAKAAREAAKNQQELADLDTKQTRERSRAEQDAQIEARQSWLNTQADTSDKKVAQIKLDYEKEKIAIRRGIEDTIKANEDAVRELWKAENPNAEKNGQTWDVQGKAWANQKGYTFGLTDAQSAKYEAKTAEATTNYQKQLQAQKQTDDQYRIDYLKQYGSMEQQRLAITEETERKIAELKKNGASEYEIAATQEAARQQLDKLNADDIFNRIDWDNVFADLEGHTKDYLIGLRNQLQDLLKSGKLTDVADIEKVQNKITEINGDINKQGGLFSFKGDKAIENDRLQANKANAEKNAVDADAEVAIAEANLDILKKTGASTDKIKLAETKLATAREKAAKATDKAVVAENAAKKTSAQSVADWFSDAEQFIAEKGIDQIPQLLDQLGLGSLSESVSKGLSGFSNAADAAADFASGNYIGAATKAISAVTDFGEALGAWSNSNRAEVEKENNRLANAMSVNTEAINRNTEAMSEGTATEKYKSYQQAVSMTQANEKYAQQVMINNAGIYDGSESVVHKFNNKYGGGELMKQISNIVGKTVVKLQDILSLSAEDLNKFYTTEGGTDVLTQLTQAIINQQDTGNYNGLAQDLLDYINEYSKDAYDELKNAFQEGVTGVSFDSFKESFESALMDMDKDASDFADDFTEELTQSFLDAQIEKKFGQEIQDLYNAWADALSDDNELTDAEVAQLQKAQEDLTQQMQDERDRIAALTGYDEVSSSEANGSINGIKSISDDTANELVGRMTAIQIGVENDTTQIALAVAQLTTMTASVTDSNRTLGDIRDLQQTGNEYLADITKYTKAMYEGWDDRLNTMTEHIKQL